MGLSREALSAGTLLHHCGKAAFPLLRRRAYAAGAAPTPQPGVEPSWFSF